MLIAKVPAVVAAVLFMSSLSAQAMEFADRPRPISEAFTSTLTVRAMQSEERSNRQLNKHNLIHPVSVEWMKLADRPRPISNLKRVWVIQTKFQNKPGRLSAEFSAVARDYSMNFEYGPGELSSWLKPTETRITLKGSHHRGPIGNLFPPLAAEDIKFADRGFTSSITKPITRLETQPRQTSGQFCVGSMAPCSSLSFAQPSRMGSLSAPYHDERL